MPCPSGQTWLLPALQMYSLGLSGILFQSLCFKVEVSGLTIMAQGPYSTVALLCLARCPVGDRPRAVHTSQWRRRTSYWKKILSQVFLRSLATPWSEDRVTPDREGV